MALSCTQLLQLWHILPQDTLAHAIATLLASATSPTAEMPRLSRAGNCYNSLAYAIPRHAGASNFIPSGTRIP
eukprot:3240268-Alexandrium_andersonii.AAC.1